MAQVILDIAAIVIIALCAALGFKVGFALSLAKLGGWIAAVVIAVFAHKPVAEFLAAHTSLDTKLNSHMERVCKQFAEKHFGGSEEPGNVATDAIKELIAGAAKAISSHAFTIFVFIGIIATITLAVFVLTLIFSKKYHDGFAGFFDGFLGAIFGLVGGAALVMLLLALLMPVKYAVGPSLYDKIDKQLKESTVVVLVYDNNPLLETINGFIPNDLDPENWLGGKRTSDDGYTHKEWGNLI